MTSRKSCPGGMASLHCSQRGSGPAPSAQQRRKTGVYLRCGLQEGMVWAHHSCCRASKQGVQDLLLAGSSRCFADFRAARLQRCRMLRPARLQLLQDFPPAGTCMQSPQQ